MLQCLNWAYQPSCSSSLIVHTLCIIWKWYIMIQGINFSWKVLYFKERERERERVPCSTQKPTRRQRHNSMVSLSGYPSSLFLEPVLRNRVRDSLLQTESGALAAYGSGVELCIREYLHEEVCWCLVCRFARSETLLAWYHSDPSLPEDVSHYAKHVGKLFWNLAKQSMLL